MFAVKSKALFASMAAFAISAYTRGMGNLPKVREAGPAVKTRRYHKPTPKGVAMCHKHGYYGKVCTGSPKSGKRHPLV